jgi:hypothetical protein
MQAQESHDGNRTGKKATEKHTCLLSIAIAVAAQTTMIIAAEKIT